MVKVELVYVAEDKATFHLKLDLKEGTILIDALNKSGIYTSRPETRTMSVGIYASLVPLDPLLKEGDRIEIYRPLTCDPKEKRRQLAKLKK